MTFEDYQEVARKTAVYPTIGHQIIYPALGLAGEVGELTEKIKKIFRDGDGDVQAHAPHLVKELGDILWYLSTMCDVLGVSLSYVATVNNEKLMSRLERGMIKGSGDNR